MPRGLLWIAIVAPPGTFLVQRLAERFAATGLRTRAFGRRAGCAARGRAGARRWSASALTSAGNALSRPVEARADAFALELTKDPRAFIGLERSLALRNLGDPDPPRLLHAALRHPPHAPATGSGSARRSGARAVLVLVRPSPNSGRFLIPSRVCHLEKLSSIASISSRMKRGERLMRETTTPGTASSSTSWSTRAKVTVNS